VRGSRGGLGCGGAVGLGGGAALLVAVIAIGHAVWHQLTGAVSLVITFALVAVCVILGAVALGVLGLLAYRGQLARLHLAERRITLEQLARGQAVRAEVLEGDGASLPRPARAAIQGEQPGNLLASVTRLPIAERGETEW
jgi:hypothetical protein